MKIIFHFITNIIDLIFPSRCITCNAWITGKDPLLLCSACRDQIKAMSLPCCKTCGKSLGQYTHPDVNMCQKCRILFKNRPCYYTYALSAFAYEHPIKDLILQWKYLHKKSSWHILKTLWHHFILHHPSLKKADLIIPVPLHLFRLIKREFNQAEELANCIHVAYNIPVLYDILIRTRKTKAMKDLNVSARRANIHGAFSLKDPSLVKDKCCLLVDDIFTTGTTLNECARILREAGVHEIIIITLARGE